MNPDEILKEIERLKRQIIKLSIRRDALMTITRKCLGCGEIIKTKHKAKKYCCYLCRDKYYKSLRK